jgi:branched-chain amino acid transport system permease protein
MNAIVLQLLIGLSFGLLLFLLSSGLTLTFGLARFVNLAHGAVFLVSAYVATTVAGPGWRFPLAILAATATGTLLSVALFSVVLLRWRTVSTDILRQVILTFGTLLLLADLTRAHWGGNPASTAAPSALDGSWTIGSSSFPTYRAFIMGAGVLVALGLWWLQDRTTFGALIRAGVDDPEMLEATGTPSRPLFAAVFALSGALAGLAGGLGSAVLGAALGQEFEILVLALVIVVLGGLGSLKGAFIISLLVGLADSYGRAYLPTFAEFTMMALVVAVLAVRPAGLFGWAQS